MGYGIQSSFLYEREREIQNEVMKSKAKTEHLIVQPTKQSP